MDREMAKQTLTRMANGLTPDAGGVARLLERIAERSEQAEELRALLVEGGAARLIDEAQS
jgi:hypothetical protein